MCMGQATMGMGVGVFLGGLQVLVRVPMVQVIVEMPVIVDLREVLVGVVVALVDQPIGTEDHYQESQEENYSRYLSKYDQGKQGPHEWCGAKQGAGTSSSQTTHGPDEKNVTHPVTQTAQHYGLHKLS